jgi:hypothetical protein
VGAWVRAWVRTFCAVDRVSVCILVICGVVCAHARVYIYICVCVCVCVWCVEGRGDTRDLHVKLIRSPLQIAFVLASHPSLAYETRFNAMGLNRR